MVANKTTQVLILNADTAPMKRLISLISLIFMLTTQAYSSLDGVVEGELTAASRVHFQLIDGLAFRNYIKVYVDGLHIGNYIGDMGARAQKYQDLIDQLEQKTSISGGNFYLDIKKRKIHGERVIEKIVHFPHVQNNQETAYDLASCQQELKDLENRASLIFQKSLRATEPLEQLINHMKKRRPAESTKPLP